MLEPTELRLYRSETEIVRFAQAEGYLQFAQNRALVLVEEAIAPEAIDRGGFATKLAEARAAAERAEDGSEEQARARARRASLRGVPVGRELAPRRAPEPPSRASRPVTG